MNIFQRTDISVKKSNLTAWIVIGILAAATLVSTLIFYPKLIVIQTPYQVGDIADENIKAARDFFIEDGRATRKKQQESRDQVLTVYDHDVSLVDQLKERVNMAFAIPRAVFEQPPALGQQKGEAVSEAVENTRKLNLRKQVWEKKQGFEKALGISISNGAYSILFNEKFSPRIPELINRILNEVLTNGVVSNKELLLRENDRGIVLKAVGSGNERHITNLRQFYSLDQAKTMVRIIGDPMLKGMEYNLVNLIVDFTQRLVQPNITLNKSETEKRRDAAEESIKPIMYQIKKGEMILREGQRISETDMLKLQAVSRQGGKKQLLGKAMGTGLIIFVLLMVTYLIHLRHRPEIAHNPSGRLLFLAAVMVSAFLIAQVSLSLAVSLADEMPFSLNASSMFYGIPLAAGAMIICQFMGFSLAFPIAVVTALLTGLLFENAYLMSLYFLINSVMGAYWSRHCRHRRDLIKTGAKLGLFNMALVAIINIYSLNLGVPEIFWDWTFAFIGGISASIVTIGVAPLVEMGFGFTTDSTLLELSNLDQPLMRRLMLEAPGTYHHSVIVGSLVEAAASEIGANPLLAKVCGYYHDIGKLKNPLHFIENQSEGKNIHNKLAPSMSCLILISHVKNGVELARANKLGQEIIDAIRQHHGTSLISYFYEKAKKQKKDQPVNIDNFRYPGPKPQSKETALVMLADQVEAAARTVEHPTASRIQGLVQQLINKTFSDNQLDECPLTLKDLHHIAKSFMKILTGIYHHRIDYPEKQTPGSAKEKNGRSDHRQPESLQNINGSNTDDRPGTLKRLGQG
ncbi:MAG: HDIG domain-containing protein [Desulfobacteraceae bacterium]|nr:HDIG domain-containing protein [Desulfobacteraceae bacterium]